jgi:cell division protease FtsH
MRLPFALGRQRDDDDVARSSTRSSRRAVALLIAGIILLIACYVVVLFVSRPNAPGTQLRYDSFLADVRDGRVHSATVQVADHQIIGQFDTQSYWVAYGDSIAGNPLFSTMIETLQASNVPVSIDPQWYKGLIGPLTILMPSLIIVMALVLTVVITRGQGGALQSMARTRSRLVPTGRARVTFADVAGVDEAVEELVEIRDYLESPTRFLAMGARVPSGILLVGPPGCGKTLLARAVAGEAQVPFFSMSGSDFVEIFVGVGAARIRDLFKQARLAAPSIIFIDELDAVGRGRTAVALSGQDEREATLNQLLVGLDGFEAAPGVVVLAATNRPDVLDPALLRPGRFDRRVFVELPDINGRLGILRVHVRGKPIGSDVDLDVVARRTPGFSGADLASVVNEAALLAARRHRTEIGQALISEAVERVVAGPERRSKLIGPRDKELIAYHEAGHAIVSAIRHPENRVTKVSVISRGRGGGFTWFVADEERELATPSQLRARMASLLGGRAAEELLAGEATSGAQDDLERATELARKMVCDLGMSERLGPVSFRTSARSISGGDGPTRHSEQIAAAMDDEIHRLISEAHDTAASTLVKHRGLLDRLATQLMEVESLEGDDLDRLLYPEVGLAVS